MSRRTNKACDSCRFRKVKCNGTHPCSQCAHLDLPCAFSPPTGKRKPGVRGRLVSQLRGQNGDPEKAASPPECPTAAGTSGLMSIGGIINPGPETPPLYGHASTPPGGSTDYSADFFLRLLPDFEQVVYPVNPVITPDEIRASVAAMHSSHEDAALIYACAAVTINLEQTSWSLNGDAAALMMDLMQRSLIAHRKADLNLNPATQPPRLGELSTTVKRVITCVFLQVSMNTFKLFNRSFVILREAISMIQTLKVFQHGPDDLLLGRPEVARRQRLYWECFIHERFLNILSGVPAMMPMLSTGLPFEDSSIPLFVDVGFRRLIMVFRIMDESFLNYWNAEQNHAGAVHEMTAEWVESKQAELDQDEITARLDENSIRAAGGTGLTELQQADIFITRLWIRTLVWQLALSRGLLRSAPPQGMHQGLSVHFPAHKLSGQLRSLVSGLESVASIGTHGSGILQKLFEITTTISDVLALPPGETQTQDDVKARMGDVAFLADFLFRFEKTPKNERNYMREKLETLQQLYTTMDFSSLSIGLLHE